MNRNRVRITTLGLAAMIAVTSTGCRGRIPSFRFGRAPAVPKVRAPEFKPAQFNPPPRFNAPRAGWPHGEMPHFPAPRPLLHPLLVRPRIPHAAAQVEEAAALASVRPHLEEIGQLGRNQQWGKLNQPVQEALRTPKLPAELQETLGAVDRQASRMQSIEELQTVISTGKLDPARVDALKKNVAVLLEATGDPELVRSVQNYLSLNAELAGYRDMARNLLPGGSREGDAFARLRDLKQSLLGEGKVRPVNPKTADGRGRQPLPEAGPQGPRPKVEESALQDMPALKKEMQAVEKELRARLKTRIEARTQGPRYYLGQNLARLQHYSRQGKQEQEEEKKKVRDQWQEEPAATVARLLGRALTPAEKARITRLLAAGVEPAAIARWFRQQEKPVVKP
jgi:hypothetical protein